MYKQTSSFPGTGLGSAHCGVEREDSHRGWDKLLHKIVGRGVWGSSGLPEEHLFASEASAFFRGCAMRLGKATRNSSSPSPQSALSSRVR